MSQLQRKVFTTSRDAWSVADADAVHGHNANAVRQWSVDQLEPVPADVVFVGTEPHAWDSRSLNLVYQWETP